MLPIVFPQDPNERLPALNEVARRAVDGTVVPLFADYTNFRVGVGMVSGMSNVFNVSGTGDFYLGVNASGTSTFANAIFTASTSAQNVSATGLTVSSTAHFRSDVNVTGSSIFAAVTGTTLSINSITASGSSFFGNVTAGALTVTGNSLFAAVTGTTFSANSITASGNIFLGSVTAGSLAVTSTANFFSATNTTGVGTWLSTGNFRSAANITGATIIRGGLTATGDSPSFVGTNPFISIDSSDADAELGITFRQAGTAKAQIIYDDGGNNSFQVLLTTGGNIGLDMQASGNAFFGALKVTGQASFINTVGVGVAAPSAPYILSVKGNTDTYIAIGSSGANTGDRGIEFRNQAGTAAGYVIIVPNTIGTDAKMYFYVGGGAATDVKMIAHDDGGIEIKDAAPAAPRANCLWKDNVPKGWARVDQTGTQSITDSFNVSSITDGGTGITTVTWDTDMANGNYSIGASSSDFHTYVNAAPATTGTQIIVTNQAGTPTDNGFLSVIVIGDQ